jgi:hypothetical protein
MTILANDYDRTDNAQAILDLYEMGWLLPTYSVLDLSVGPEGGFWTKVRPSGLRTNDLDPNVESDYCFDARQAPFADNSWDVTVWDGPYGYRGASRLASDVRYGLTEYRSADEIDALIIAGTIEAMRLARELVLVKCQDQNVASKFRDQSGFVTEAVRKEGGRILGKLYVRAHREQPAGKKQLNVWGYHSVLLLIAP